MTKYQRTRHYDY